MNCDTGHLITEEMFKRLSAEKQQAYVGVPADLEPAAIRKLQGQDEAYVSLSSGGKLSKFAAANRKHRRKLAKQSRKVNR